MVVISSNKGQFVFVSVIFIVIAFIIIFGLFSPVLSEATDDFIDKWGESSPFISWLVGSVNIWVFIGFIMFVLGSLAFNVVLGR